jgi:hypothetical protein
MIRRQKWGCFSKGWLAGGSDLRYLLILGYLTNFHNDHDSSLLILGPRGSPRTYDCCGSPRRRRDTGNYIGRVRRKLRVNMRLALARRLVCATFPAMTAIGKGLDSYVAVDASGTFSETKRQAGLLRMLQAGVVLSDYATLMVEILRDNARPEASEVYGAMDMGWAKLVGQVAQAYGK